MVAWSMVLRASSKPMPRSKSDSARQRSARRAGIRLHSSAPLSGGRAARCEAIHGSGMFHRQVPRECVRAPCSALTRRPPCTSAREIGATTVKSDAHASGMVRPCASSEVLRMIGNLLRAALSMACLLRVGIGATANAQTLALVGGKVYASPDAVAARRCGRRHDQRRHHRDRQPQRRADPVRCAHHRLHRQDGRGRLLEQPRPFHAKPCGRTPARAPAAPLTAHMQDDADAMGFHHRVGPRLRSAQLDAVAPPRRFRRGARSQLSSSPAASSPRTAIPPISPPRCNCPRPTRRSEAAQMARHYMGIGLDGIKLFTGSFKGENKPVVNMDAAIAKAAVDVAHAQGKPVFAHPQNTAGVEAVIAAGVDVMAHTVGRRTGLFGRATRALQAAGHCADSDPVAVCKAAGRDPTSPRASSPTPSISSRRFPTMAARSCSAPTSASPRSTTPRSNMS